MDVHLAGHAFRCSRKSGWYGLFAEGQAGKEAHIQTTAKTVLLPRPTESAPFFLAQVIFPQRYINL